MASSAENARRKKRRDQEVKNRIKNMSKEAMAAAIARKKECNARAMLIVEQLIEPNVEQIWLLENLKHINQSHFQDIVEERAITRFCGYPLCDEELTNIPKKMYKISTKENKVYDITDRKNYCSNTCYKAGTYLKDQLYTSPLWLRDCEIPVEYKILSGRESQGSGVGAEIDLGNTHPVKLDKHSEKEGTSSTKIEGISDIQKKSNILKHKNPSVKVTTETVDPIKPEIGQQQSNDLSDSISSNLRNAAIHSSELVGSAQIVTKESAEILKLNEPCKDFEHSISTVKDEYKVVLSASGSNENQEACPLKKTDQLLNIDSPEKTEVVLERPVTVSVEEEPSDLKNDAGINNHTSENVSKANEVSCKNKTNKSKKTSLNKYRSQTKKNMQNIDSESPMTCIVSEIEQRIESWFTLESMVYLLGQERLRELLKISGFKEDFPLPKSSKKEEYLFYQKCQEIYRKLNILELKDKEKLVPSKAAPEYESLQKEADVLELKVKSFFQGDAKVTFAPTEDVKDSANDDSDAPALPLIDHYSVMATRRRIFIEKLNKVLPDMLSALELSQFLLGCEIHELVSTFNLEATNICLRPPEWTLVAIMIIKLLTINNDILNFHYCKELTQRRLITYLLTYDLDGGYVDRFTSYLMDIERIADALHKE